MVGARVRDRLKHVKSGLQSILQMLSRDGHPAAELQLRFARLALGSPAPSMTAWRSAQPATGI